MGARNGKFYGTEVVINLWKPYVQVPDEFSLAQTWIVSGSGSSLNTIEAGWQVCSLLHDLSLFLCKYVTYYIFFFLIYRFIQNYMMITDLDSLFTGR